MAQSAADSGDTADAAVSDDAAGDRPLVEVAGFGDSPYSLHWDTFNHNLEQAGYDGPVRRVQIDDPYASPAASADAVGAAVEEMADQYDTAVNVVAHSMGGLTARWYVEQAGGDDYVESLVTLGTPHQGAYNACAAPFTGGGRAMCPGSGFLDELNADLSEEVSYTAIYSETDELMRTFVWGYLPGWRELIDDVERGRLPHADMYENVENIAVSGYGHFDLLTDDDILDLYRDELSASAES